MSLLCQKLQGPIILFRLFWDYFCRKGFVINWIRKQIKIIYCPVNYFFRSGEDKSYGRQKLDRLKISSNDTSLYISTHRPSEHSDDKRTAHSVASRFKKDEKFPAQIGEDVNKSLEGYTEAAIDYELSATQSYATFIKFSTEKRNGSIGHTDNLYATHSKKILLESRMKTAVLPDKIDWESIYKTLHYPL